MFKKLNNLLLGLVVCCLLQSKCLYASTGTPEFCWVKTHSSEAYINLPCDYTSIYNYIWYGDEVYDSREERIVADGKGNLALAKKNTEYRSGKIQCEFSGGIPISSINFTKTDFYRCLNDDCTEIETKPNKKNEKFRGSVNFDSNSLTIESFDSGTLYSDNFYYSGDFKNFSPHGYGTICYGLPVHNEDYLTLSENSETPFPFSFEDGYWEDGHFIEGYVRIFYTDGGMYEGNFLNGEPTEWGKFKIKNNSYIGQFKNGSRNGYGIYNYPDGSQYEGEWVDNSKHGFGELDIKPKNISYTGEFQEGNIHGNGILKLNNDMIYIGNFSANKPHGSGIIVDQDQNYYECIFENGSILNIIPLSSTEKENPLLSFFVSNAYASSNLALFDGIKNKIAQIKQSVTESIVQVSVWVKENKEHIINAGKG